MTCVDLFLSVLIHVVDVGINCVGRCCVSPGCTSLSSGGCVSDATRLRTVEKREGIEILHEGVWR